jgi:hypothetical protein
VIRISSKTCTQRAAGACIYMYGQIRYPPHHRLSHNVNSMGSTLSIGALRPTDYLAVAAVAAFLFWATRPRSRGTKLRGPPRSVRR